MNVIAKFSVLIFIASFSAGILVQVIGWGEFVIVAMLPAIFLSAIATMGHLVTLDDDMPGGWSNPDDSKLFALRSVCELILKVGLFCLTVYIGMRSF